MNRQIAETFTIKSKEAVNVTSAQSTSIYQDLDCESSITIGSGEFRITSQMTNNRFLTINVLENSQTIIYDFNELTDATSYQQIKINVADNASLYVLSIDKMQQANVNRTIEVGKNSQVHYHVIGLNKLENSNAITINLNDKYSSADFKLITVANDQTYNHYNVYVNNLAPQTTGNIWQKAVCMRGGRNDFVATGHIKKGCDDAQNFQESRVLLLDEASLGNASPLLLIDHYNVMAGHAAGVSRVESDELYYLQSRGITLEEAEKLMTIAFISPLIDQIRDETIKANILQEIQNKLHIED